MAKRRKNRHGKKTSAISGGFILLVIAVAGVSAIVDVLGDFWLLLVIVCAVAIAWKIALDREAAAESDTQEAGQHAEIPANEPPNRNERALAFAAEREEEERRRAEAQSAFEKRQAERLASYENMVAGLESAAIAVADKPASRGRIEDWKFSNITVKSKPALLGDFVSVDVETTGLSVRSSEIVEVAAVRFRGFVPTAKFDTLCAPKRGIDQESSRVNKITEEMVSGKPTFQQIAASLQEFIGEDNIVGHNLAFDLNFLSSYGIDFSSGKRKFFDTLSLSRRTWAKLKVKRVRDPITGDYEEEYDYMGSGEVEDYKLGTLCHYLQIVNPIGHRALGDAIAAGQLFEKIVRMRVPEQPGNEQLPMRTID